MWQSSSEIWISGFQLKDKKKREIVDRHALDRLGLAMTIFVDVTPCTLNPKPESRCEAAGLLRHLVPRNDETDQIGQRNKYFLKPEARNPAAPRHDQTDFLP